MFNVIEVLRSASIARILPGIRKFEIGDLLFAHFTCSPSETWEASWAEHDRLVHVATGNKTLRTGTGTWDIRAGDSVFLKKGACFLRHSDAQDLCLFMYFIPDDFVRVASIVVSSANATLSSYLRMVATS